jgi:hypothetical protein
VTPPERLPIARNTALLSAALAANSGMLQLSAAVASLSLVTVIGVHGLLGLGPAIVEVSSRGLAPGAIETVNKGVQLSAIRDPEGNTITFIGDFRVQY